MTARLCVDEDVKNKLTESSFKVLLRPSYIMFHVVHMSD